ncbi:hypothetical protein RKD22_000799 [Streptomyces pristinaespiralis]
MVSGDSRRTCSSPRPRACRDVTSTRMAGSAMSRCCTSPVHCAWTGSTSSRNSRIGAAGALFAGSFVCAAPLPGRSRDSAWTPSVARAPGPAAPLPRCPAALPADPDDLLPCHGPFRIDSRTSAASRLLPTPPHPSPTPAGGRPKVFAVLLTPVHGRPGPRNPNYGTLAALGDCRCMSTLASLRTFVVLGHRRHRGGARRSTDPSAEPILPRCHGLPDVTTAQRVTSAHAKPPLVTHARTLG